MTLETNHSGNSLINQVFADNLDRNIFIKWLEINDSIEPCFVNRNKYESKLWNILVKIQNNWPHKPDSYRLFLPNNLNGLELFSIIWKIENITASNSEYCKNREAVVSYLLSVTWISVAKIFKNRILDRETINTKINELIFEYWDYFTKEQLDKLRQLKIWKLSKENDVWHNVSLSTAKDVLRKLKNDGDIDKVFTDSKTEDATMDFITRQFRQCLDRVIFRRWKKTLYDYMKTFTQEDYNGKLKTFRLFGLTIRFGYWLNKKEDCDRAERALKEAIWIEKLKKNIKKAKEKLKDWDSSELSMAEMDAVAKINKFLSDNYPNDQKNWVDASGSPSHILKTKEMMCVGKAIIIHLFLEDLWINNSALCYWNHIAIMYRSPDNLVYLVDPTNYQKVLEVKIWQKQWEYYWIKFKDPLEKNYYKTVKISECENALIVGIYSNKWTVLAEWWEYEEAIWCIDKANELNPEEPYFYSAKCTILRKLKRYKYASLYLYTCHILEWNKTMALFNYPIFYPRIIKTIKNLVKEKKYDVLRKYLLSLDI